jgi:hypothetical protein
VVGIRNLSGRWLYLNGSLQLLAEGPGVPVVVRQPVRRLVAADQTSTVRLAFRPETPGVYRVRAVFLPR